MCHHSPSPTPFSLHSLCFDYTGLLQLLKWSLCFISKHRAFAYAGFFIWNTLPGPSESTWSSDHLSIIISSLTRWIPLFKYLEALNKEVILYLFVWFFDCSFFPSVNYKLREDKTVLLTTVPSVFNIGFTRGECYYNRHFYAQHLILSLAHSRHSANVAERVTKRMGCECSKLLEETRKFSKMFTLKKKKRLTVLLKHSSWARQNM